MWVGLIQSVEELNRTEGLSFPWVRGNSFRLPECFWTRTSIFPVFRLELKHQLFLGVEPVGLQNRIIPLASLGLMFLNLEWSYPMSSPGSPACQLKILGLVSSQNCVSQFHIIHTHTHTLSHAVGLVFLENLDKYNGVQTDIYLYVLIFILFHWLEFY